MKAHSQDFKDKIKLMGRQLDSKITYTIDDEEIELGKEELNSITPHYQGSLLKSVMKQLDIDSNVDIPLGTEVNYQLGLLNDNEYEYLDYGNYIVYSNEKQEDTRSYKIVCYDKMLYSMVDYKGLIGISFPMTIRDYIGHISALMGLTFKNENDIFANYDRILQTDPYVQINEDDGSIQPMDYTIRDVLDELSQVTASTICINADDELELRDINITDTNDFEIEGATTQETAILPSEYQQVEYIQANGPQYIDTGVIPSFDRPFKCEVNYGVDDLNSRACILSNYAISKHISYEIVGGNYFTRLYIDNGRVDRSTWDVNLPINHAYFEIDNGTYTTAINGATNTGTFELTGDSGGQLRMFLDTAGRSSTFTKPLKIYELKLYDNNVLIRHFIPCYRVNDNEIGMYDLVNNVFYDNDGTGTFTKGANVTLPNHDYPIPVINKTGEIEEEINGELRKINLGSVELCGIGDYKDKLRRSQGKNKFDGEFRQGAESSATNTTTIFSKNDLVLEAGTYTFSCDLSMSTYKYALGTSASAFPGVASWLDGGFQTNQTLTFTINETLHIGVLITKVAGGNLSPDDVSNYRFQFEKGQTKTDYEPYYPKGTWYKRSAIGKVVLDGSESWSYDTTNHFFLTTFSNAKHSLANLDIIVLSDNFKGEEARYATNPNYDYIICINTNGYTLLRDSDYTSAANFKTWLNTHNTTAYYVLANPTYEPITDTTAIRSLNDTGLDEIDEEYLKDVNVKFGEKYGPVNSLVLSRSANSDNIFVRDDDSIQENGLCELRIADNLILNNDDRDEYINAIFDKVRGLEYFINDYSSTGVCYYDLLDRYDVKVGDEHYPCIMLNDEINVTQGLVEEIHADALEHSETDYTKADKTDRKINQTTLIVDKQNGIITAKVEALDKNYQDLNNNLYGENGDIAKLGTRIDQKADGVTFNTYKERIDNGDIVIDNTMVLINNEGINVSTDDSKISTQITNNAFEIKDSSGTELAFFGYDETENTSKSQFDNLNITRYLTAGNHRIEKCGTNMERTGWFYIGGSQ